MATKSGVLDHWRGYFRSSNSNLFEIIENAIIVAAKDCPKEFRLRRDRIAEVLYSCRLSRCLGCDRVEIAVAEHDDDDDDDDNGENEGLKGEFCGIKGNDVNSSCRDGELGEMNAGVRVPIASNCSYGEAEALTDEIEEEREVVGEVMRIKEVLSNSEEKSESVIFESLRRLQLMALNFYVLDATKVGMAVNALRKHGSKQIRHLARALIDKWKVIVDGWVKATSEVAEGTPDSVNPSVLDEEEGLPSPPLDEGAFFTTQTMELSQFFDGMDDDGNPQNSGEFDKNREGVRKPTLVKQDVPKQKEQTLGDNKVPQIKKQQPVPKPNKVPITESGPGRPVKVNGERKSNGNTKVQQKSEKPLIQKRPAPSAERLKRNDEDAVQEKLEATKRKLQERYQQAENAKRQRTIQVMELHDLPKQGLVQKNTHGKFGNSNRHWANVRR